MLEQSPQVDMTEPRAAQHSHYVLRFFPSIFGFQGKCPHFSKFGGQLSLSGGGELK